ncbi:MAG: SDR family oxidoreductase [Planctomycetota bacterium]
MDLQLKDRVIWITGAGGGIGHALAEGFGLEGARLALHARTSGQGLSDWAETREWRDNAMILEGDLREPGDLIAMARRVLDTWGVIDVAIGNAALRVRSPEPLHEMGDDRLRDLVDTNVLGQLFFARTFLRTLKDREPDPGFGRNLIFIGSTAATFGEAGYAGYAASKAALTGLCKSLKNEIVALDPQGRVNIVEPGWTRTIMSRPDLNDPKKVEHAMSTMPLRRIGEGFDVTHACTFLASMASRHVTGQTITVAGGMEGRLLHEPGDFEEE